jgi:phosphatidylglycerophosphate synthase
MHYSLNDIRNSLPKDKNKGDSLWVRFVVRKVSFLTTFVFVNVGISAWLTSFLSIFVALSACVLFFFDNQICRIVGICLVHLWLLFDCTDGNIARVTKTQSQRGAFIDGVSGYTISSFCFLSIGMAAYFTAASPISQLPFFYILLGALASSFNILPRLVFQKYAATVDKDRQPSSGGTPSESSPSFFSRIRKILGKELGLSGLFMVALPFAEAFRLYSYMIMFYAAFNCLACFVTIFHYSLMAKHEK